MKSGTMFCAIFLSFLVVPTASLSLRKIQSMDDHFAPDLTKKALPQDTIKTLNADAVRKAQKLWADEINTCATPQSGKAFRLMSADASAEAEQQVDALLGQGPFDEFSDLPSAVWKELQPDIEAMSHVSTLPSLPEGWNMRAQSHKVSKEDVAKAQDLFTTATCKLTAGSQRDSQETTDNLHTCEFHNLYFEHGGFVAHVLDDGTATGKAFPAHDIKLRMDFARVSPLKMLMAIKLHKDAEAFAQYLAAPQYVEKKGTTLFFTPRWHFNFGHAFYDSLYPAFVSLIQFGRDQEAWRVLLNMGGTCPGNIEARVPGACENTEHLMGDIGAGGLDYTYKLKASQESYRFETVVCGVGLNMQKMDMGASFRLGQGRELNAASLFRKKVYATLGLPEPVRAPAKSELQGIIIHNKRYGTRNGDQPSWADELIEKAKAQGVNLKYISWTQVLREGEQKGKAPNNPSPGLDKFRSHLELLLDTDIHISGPGTGMMYQQFLRDGSVHINLGERPGGKLLPGVVPRYMEEYMAEGAPYIKALYYYNKGTEKDTADNIMELVQQAKEQITNRFQIPVPEGGNLSPLGKVAQAYFYLTQDAEDTAALAPFHAQVPAAGLKEDQFSYKCTKFIGERVGVSNEQECSLNNCLLSKLMESYGPPCAGCEWPVLKN